MPINDANDAGGVRVIVMIEEHLLEDAHGTWEIGVTRTIPVRHQLRRRRNYCMQLTATGLSRDQAGSVEVGCAMPRQNLASKLLA